MDKLVTETVNGSGSHRGTLIILHGLGDSLEGFRWAPEVLGFSWLRYILVNAPDHYYGGYSWYDIMGDSRPGVERSRAALFELLKSLEAEGTDPNSVMIMGFSQGGLMATEVGVTCEKPLRGLIGISGYVFDLDGVAARKAKVFDRQSFLITHGAQDDVVPISKSRPQYTSLKEQGFSIDWREYNKGHTLDPQREIPDIKAFIERRFGQ